MNEIRRIHLALAPGATVAEIPLAGSDGGAAASGQRAPWQALLSLRAAGHMGRETAERRLNRARLFRSLGLEPERVFGATQVHGCTVLAVEGGAPADYLGREADGLVTARPDVVLSVTVADCLPIFLFSKGSGARGLVHSGWKGTGIAARAVGLMRDRYGVRAGELEAVIGPGIGVCCYAVDRARYDGFTAEFGPESGVVRDGRFFLDLKEANVRLLRSLGVRSITVIDNCTHCEPLLGSYRRDGRDGFHNMIVLFGRLRRMRQLWKNTGKCGKRSSFRRC